MLALMQYAPLVVLLLIAAAEDVRARRVPNWISFGLILSGIALSCSRWGHISFAQALLGFSTGFAIVLLLHLLGAVGAGDVKLVAGVGAWIGVAPVIVACVGAAVIGMLIALVICIRERRLKDVMRSSVLLAVNITGGTTGISTRAHTYSDLQLTRKRTLPFALAITIATIGVIVAQHVLNGRA